MLVGIQVTCTVCGLQKKPHGRSSPIGLSYCDENCPGYNEPPYPGCLWPGETAHQFGFPICNNATRIADTCSICRRPEFEGEPHNHVCE